MMEEEGRCRGFDLSDSSANESVFVSSDDSEDDVLHPAAAAIARDRAVPKNLSENPKKKRSSEKLPKKISNSVRLLEFPNEYLDNPSILPCTISIGVCATLYLKQFMNTTLKLSTSYSYRTSLLFSLLLVLCQLPCTILVHLSLLMSAFLFLLELVHVHISKL